MIIARRRCRCRFPPPTTRPAGLPGSRSGSRSTGYRRTPSPRPARGLLRGERREGLDAHTGGFARAVGAAPGLDSRLVGKAARSQGTPRTPGDIGIVTVGEVADHRLIASPPRAANSAMNARVYERHASESSVSRDRRIVVASTWSWTSARAAPAGRRRSPRQQKAEDDHGSPAQFRKERHSEPRRQSGADPAVRRARRSTATPR